MGDLHWELRALEILGWDHCHKCCRSQCRFHFYYQEQFDAIVFDQVVSDNPLVCIFCGGEISTYCESEKGPFARPDGWKIPSKAEFGEHLAQLNAEFDCDLTMEKFTARCSDYMNRLMPK